MIKVIIKSQKGMVLVFDTEGEQLPEYQGYYEDVKALILRDAPPNAVFSYWPGLTDKPIVVPRGNW